MKSAWIAAAALSLVGCFGSSEPSYYSLAVRPGAAVSGAPALIELRRPAVAGYLDRADIVTRVEDYKLRVDSSERWAEPLGDMVGRVLAQNLSTRLGGSQLFVEGGAISAIPDAIVAVDVQRFDVGEDGQVNLVAQVVIETPTTRQAARSEHVELHDKPSGRGTAALAASMSTLLGQLSDRISALLRAR